MESENLPDKTIIDFIKKHHILTLSVSEENSSWCANCFYIYNKLSNSLIFTSDKETKHISLVLKNPQVSGTIFLDTRIIGKIQGIQFSGIVKEAQNANLRQAKKLYFLRFPYAIVHESCFWILELTYIKMTDNRLGFGKKLIWEKGT